LSSRVEEVSESKRTRSFQVIRITIASKRSQHLNQTIGGENRVLMRRHVRQELAKR
jgi:hypothetical protein